MVLINSFYASAKIRNLCTVEATIFSLCPDVCPVPTSAFFAPHKYWTDFNEICGGGVVTTTTNRWSDYILGDIVPGTRKQDTTEKLESTSNWCCHVTNNVTVSQFIQHAAAAVLASPLHTCNGEGIVWPRAVFSSLGFNYVVSYIVIVICNVYAYRVTNLACPKCLNREDLVESNIRSTIFRVKFGPSWPNLDLRSVFLLCVQLCNFIMHLSLTC